MAKKVSRRELLEFGAASVAGGLIAFGSKAEAATPGRPTEYGSNVARKPTQDSRTYWGESYSGGRADVKPLSPAQPGKDYSPVVVPNGAVLPFKIVNGVKVFHLIAEEINHS